MKRLALCILAAFCLVCLFGCRNDRHRVRVIGSHAAECDVKPEYDAGEEVTVKLPSITEHYYVLYVNDCELRQDRSDMEYTYFRFTMPEEDVLIRVEDRDVSIPVYQGLVPQGEIAAITVSSLPAGYEYRFSDPEDTAQIRDYFNSLALITEYSDTPDPEGMTWVTEIRFANGYTMVLYHMSNMLLMKEGGHTYKMEYEQAAAYGSLLNLLASGGSES